jgi:hypothetical protein
MPSDGKKFISARICLYLCHTSAFPPFSVRLKVVSAVIIRLYHTACLVHRQPLKRIFALSSVSKYWADAVLITIPLQMAHAMLLRALLQTHVYSFTALTPYRWMEQSDCQRRSIFARGPRVVGVATVRLIIQKGMYSEFTFLHGALASLDRNLLGNQSDHGLDRSVLEGRPQGFEGVQSQAIPTSVQCVSETSFSSSSSRTRAAFFFYTALYTWAYSHLSIVSKCTVATSWLRSFTCDYDYETMHIS